MWYHNWLLEYPRSYWPDWMRKKLPAKGTIEVKIWHVDRLNAARVIKDYAEVAIEDAWGRDYNVDASVRRESLPDKSESELWSFVRDDSQEKAKDVNVICVPHTNNRGGGSVCMVSVDTPWEQHPDVGDLWVKPNTGGNYEIKEFAKGKPYDLISSALHEIGHCLGLGHNIGNVTRHNGEDWADIMPYVDMDNYRLRYSAEAKNYAIDVR